MGIVGLDRLGTRGSPSFSSDGTISFDPAGQFEFLAAGQTATTNFRYQVDAGNGVTGFGTVQVTVVGVNDAPTARPDAPCCNLGRGTGHLYRGARQRRRRRYR